MLLSAFLAKIDWDAIERAHVSRDGQFYSAAVEVDKQRRLLSIGCSKGTTTLTISDMKGNILLHAVQSGTSISYYKPKAGAANSSVFGAKKGSA